MNNRLMIVNGRRKQGLDFLADLWSGRLSQTLAQLFEMVLQLHRWRKEMTQNEKTIMDAASAITEAAENIAVGIQALKNRLDETETPSEDLSDELTALDNAVATLKGVGDSLKPAQSPGVMAQHDPVDVSNGSQVPMTAPGEPEAPGTQALANAVQGQADDSSSSSSDEPMPSGTGTGTGSNVPPDSPANVIGDSANIGNAGASVPAETDAGSTDEGTVDEGTTEDEGTDDEDFD